MVCMIACVPALFSAYLIFSYWLSGANDPVAYSGLSSKCQVKGFKGKTLEGMRQMLCQYEHSTKEREPKSHMWIIYYGNPSREQ